MTNNLFNTNLFDSKNIASLDEFISTIKPLIEEILRERFPNDKYRQTVKIHGNNRIGFACPFCGDSHLDSHKKRGNIILSNGTHQYMYKCFNCDAYMSIDKFLSTYRKTTSLDIIDYIKNNKATNSFIRKDTSTNFLFDISLIDEVAIDVDYLKNKLGLINVNKDNDGGIYLMNRNQYDFSRFLFDNVNKVLYILNLTPSGKVIGIQTRPIIKTFNAKYKTYKLSNIYELLLREKKEIKEDIDTLSMFFNILLVDYNNPIVVLEGPLDSFLVKNAIATCGAGKSIPIDLNFYYLYDSDSTGYKKSVDKLESGNYVFLWEKFKKELGLPQRPKWDINDVVNYCKTNNKKVPFILNYFGNDKFDIIDL